MTVADTLTMRYFPVVVNGDKSILCRVHPLKQRLVLQIREAAKEFPTIQRIYLFGSSTTGLCHIDSDTDLCMKCNTPDGMPQFETVAKIGELCDWNCDILSYATIDAKLKTIIEKEGVLIYE